MKRLETGKIKCDDDWSGIFIRGDEALGHATSIDFTLSDTRNIIHPVNREMLETLRDILKSAGEHNGVDPQLVNMKQCRYKFIAGGEYKLLFFNTGVKQVSEIPAYYKGSIQTYIDGVLSLFDEGFVTINKVKNDN